MDAIPLTAKLDWVEASNGIPGEYAPVPTQIIVDDEEEQAHPEVLCWFGYDLPNADEWAKKMTRACNNFDAMLDELKLLTATIERMAGQLDEWAEHSVRGGWSTHQVDPMRKERDVLSEVFRKSLRVITNAEKE